MLCSRVARDSSMHSWCSELSTASAMITDYWGGNDAYLFSRWKIMKRILLSLKIQIFWKQLFRGENQSANLPNSSCKWHLIRAHHFKEGTWWVVWLVGQSDHVQIGLNIKVGAALNYPNCSAGKWWSTNIAAVEVITGMQFSRKCRLFHHNFL